MKNDRKEEIAGHILDYVRDRLVIFMPYFNRAVLLMPVIFEENPEGVPLRTDGDSVYADPGQVIAVFDREQDALTRMYLHLVFHCVLLHPFHPEEQNREDWDLACDLAVEKTVLELEGVFRISGDEERELYIRQAVEEAGSESAERICHWLKTRSETAGEVRKRTALFAMDGHSLWLTADSGKGRIVYTGKSAPDDPGRTAEKWLRVQQTVKVSGLSHQKSMGDEAGTGIRLPGRPDRDTYDYTEFLMRFAAPYEVVEVNPEEFDYICYLYGLSLYENMPLIEPLEYRDARRIRDFVIAIDTSGSCQGHVVKNFLNKTWSILKNSRAFTQPMNLYLIQCDCEIQSEVTVRTDEEFTEYMENIEIRGAGGTDFRPVFRRIDELIRDGAFHDFRGLLYFTDGYGRFPELRPSYRTAFAFVGDRVKVPELPYWAEHIILRDSGGIS